MLTALSQKKNKFGVL